MNKWKPADCIALIIVITCAVLLMAGRDSIVAYTLLGVTVCYFGLDLSGITEYIKLKRRK